MIDLRCPLCLHLLAFHGGDPDRPCEADGCQHSHDITVTTPASGTGADQ